MWSARKRASSCWFSNTTDGAKHDIAIVCEIFGGFRRNFRAFKRNIFLGGRGGGGLLNSEKKVEGDFSEHVGNPPIHPLVIALIRYTLNERNTVPS